MKVASLFVRAAGVIFVLIPALLSSLTISAAPVNDLADSAATKLAIAAKAEISIVIDGSGSVSPNYNNRLLKIGGIYRITARPAKGFSFNGWSGATNTRSRTITFVMQSNIVFVADFEDTGRPVNVILSPKLNQRGTNSPVVATGKVKDNTGVACVWFQLNGGVWTLAATTNGDRHRLALKC